MTPDSGALPAAGTLAGALVPARSGTLAGGRAGAAQSWIRVRPRARMSSLAPSPGFRPAQATAWRRDQSRAGRAAAGM